MCASVNVISATKNIVGMIKRRRRITYLSTTHWPRSECIARRFQNASPETEGAGSRRPLHATRRAFDRLALLRHVRIGPACFLEAERGQIEALHPRLLKHRVRVVVDPGCGRILRQETRGLLVEVVTLLRVGLLVTVGHEL